MAWSTEATRCTCTHVVHHVCTRQRRWSCGTNTGCRRNRATICACKRPSRARDGARCTARRVLPGSKRCRAACPEAPRPGCGARYTSAVAQEWQARPSAEAVMCRDRAVGMLFDFGCSGSLYCQRRTGLRVPHCQRRAAHLGAGRQRAEQRDVAAQACGSRGGSGLSPPTQRNDP